MPDTTDPATDLTPAERELLESVADEFLHNFTRGRRLVAVDGADPVLAAAFADDLAAVLAERAPRVARRSTGEADDATVRASVITPFRLGTLDGATDADTVLVIDGRHLLDGSTRDLWHFSVWTLQGDELPHAAATVIVDATVADAPGRFFYDYCKLPPSVNRPGL